MRHTGTFTGTYHGTSSAGVGPWLIGLGVMFVGGSLLWARIEEQRAVRAVAQQRAAEAAARAAANGHVQTVIPVWVVVLVGVLVIAVAVLVAALFVRTVNRHADAYQAERGPVPDRPAVPRGGGLVEIKTRPVDELPEGGVRLDAVRSRMDGVWR